MPSNRSLNVTVNFIGRQANDNSYGGTVTYTQNPGTPPMPGVVDSNGNINLDNMPGNSEFNAAVGMNFTLNAVVTDRNGNNVPCIWAHPITKACVITGPGGVPTNMIPTVTDPLHLTIANPNHDGTKPKVANRTYTYKLGVMLPTVGDYFIGLDPTIINTGPKFV